MTLRYRDIALELDEEESLLLTKVASQLGLEVEELKDFRVVRRSVDARQKPRVKRIFTVEFDSCREEQLLANGNGKGRIERCSPVVLERPQPISSPLHVVVVGMGPAGLFSALRLAEAGAQVTLMDMGDPVEERVRRVEAFWGQGRLDPLSNVQFGEGGAGTFSDGKLSTRVKHAGIREVLQTLVRFGSDPIILEQAKPHVGTDRLRSVLIQFRKHLQSMGIEIRYRCQLTGIEFSRGRLCCAVVNQQESMPCDALVLAPGHSATQTFEMLQATGVRLEPKPFAVGVRVDHPVELINEIQYGMPGHDNLSAADYALTFNDRQTGRGVYSFCMCPGGDVINASSEDLGVVVNGMSRRLRDGARSNSALVVTVREADFFKGSALDGLYFQRTWERKAFQAAGGGFKVPVQNLLGFLNGDASVSTAMCPPGVSDVALDEVLPDFVVHGIRTALPHFDRKMRGFVSSEANLYGVETRTSSPLRIPRNEYGESLSHQGLYPAGEGAGYAGGIMSAALDGMKVADAILNK
ncbi:MAG: hypothetical protein C0624_06150 [Desulfuromonas sp.]|nr:MAG: hypothetical protein C0624_06150 [Desulfuromonas sp.]